MTKQEFRVWVEDKRTRMFVVAAEDEQEAYDMVSASEDADVEFGGVLKDSYWAILCVEPCSRAYTGIPVGTCGLYLGGDEG